MGGGRNTLFAPNSTQRTHLSIVLSKHTALFFAKLHTCSDDDATTKLVADISANAAALVRPHAGAYNVAFATTDSAAVSRADAIADA